jgi:Zn-dependent peptidase ImmA (M78 family)
MAETVSIKPELIRWAVDRSRLPVDDLAQAFPKLDEWQRGERLPTFRQLEQFANRTMPPLGYFFLDAPPDEELPIPDFRTRGDTPIERPSPNLLETIQAMQRRQGWMREYVIDDGQEALEFVGSAANAQNVVSLAARIRDALGLDADWAENQLTWEHALRTLRTSAERIGILVASSSVVGLNTHRPLHPEEFRGFVLPDEYAPLIFVNSADSKSAQMFTLGHELVHVWIGQGGLFNLINTMPHRNPTEVFCNQTAAEFLVPQHKLSERWREAKKAAKPFSELARIFKVSPVAAARRALDLKLISRDEFFAFYDQDQAEWQRRKDQERAKETRGGPNFYDVQDVRLGKRFAYAVVRAAREGRLLYREAYELTDLRGATFDRYASRLMQRMVDDRG